VTADPTRPERIIAADQAATDEGGHNVYDQLAGAIESIVVSTRTLAGLGVEGRRQRKALRDLETEMEAEDREYGIQRGIDLTHYALRFLADGEVPPLLRTPEYADLATSLFDELVCEQESAA
jgi:hypothetical protein